MKKKLQSDSIVIVCEGTTTEYNYFNECAEWVKTHYPNRFAEIRVVPHPDDIIVKPNPKRGNLRRSIKNSPSYHYHTVEEDSEESYTRFKQQPTRYVREAQLIMNREGYTEAWAVYDQDVHADHAGAVLLQQSDVRLHIAYSGYSFEEWLLCHFERNSLAFTKSDCVDANKNSLCCGTNQHPNDCHGAVCIAGCLRQKQFIPNFAKSDVGLFEKYTLNTKGEINKKVLINSAWTRLGQVAKSFYQCNPYTNVDKLLCRLLEIKNEYEWQPLGKHFSYLGSELCVDKVDSVLNICITGTRRIVFTSGKIVGLDDNYDIVEDVIVLVENIGPLGLNDKISYTPAPNVKFMAFQENEVRCVIIEI